LTPQHINALARANEIKTARAVLKRQVAARQVTVSAVVLTCPPAAETMTIFNLLRAQPFWGPEKSRRFLQSMRISETRKVGDLTERQQRMIVARLNGTEFVDWAVAA
jgi:hypothetical protein